MSDTAARIRKLIADYLGQDIDVVTDEKDLFDDLGAHSLDRVELVMQLETEFDIVIGDDATEETRTVGGLVKLVEAARS